MLPRREIDKNNDGCCWRKFFIKPFRKRKQKTKPHIYCKQDEMIYLNFYLSALEKKMQAIEDVAKVKWFRQEVDTQNGLSHITGGFRYVTDTNCKPSLPVGDHFIDSVDTKMVPAGKFLSRNSIVQQDNTDVIIQEIMSLGDSGSLNYENKHFNSSTSPAEVSEDENINDCSPYYSVMNPPLDYSDHILGKYHVAVLNFPVETYTARVLAFSYVETLTPQVRASCNINYYDTENKTVEITYDNLEWDKKGTIVLKDIENQIDVQAELIGRVVCYLLGMGDAGVKLNG